MLLRYKDYVAFLRYNHLQTYIELTKIYSEQMEQIYDERLKVYFKDTAKLIARAPRSSDFLFSPNQPGQSIDTSFQFNDTMNTTVREAEEQIQA